MNTLKLSIRAWGCWFVIAQMKKQGENITLELIASKTSSSVSAIRNAVNELIEKGYLERKFIRNEGATIKGISYIVKASPKVKRADE